MEFLLYLLDWASFPVPLSQERRDRGRARKEEGNDKVSRLNLIPGRPVNEVRVYGHDCLNRCWVSGNGTKLMCTY